MYNPFSLSGKTILITGASSGIGKAAAIECSKLGATLILVGRNEEKLLETFSGLEGNDREHKIFIADLSLVEELVNLVVTIPVIDGCVCHSTVLFSLCSPAPTL